MIAAAGQTTGLLNLAHRAVAGHEPVTGRGARLYHSLLFLLDDGRVISVTSNPSGGVTNQSTSFLVYSPPYLSRGARPSITTSPMEVSYGGTYSVGVAAAPGRTVTRITVTTAPS